jgi:hypothetical protein
MPFRKSLAALALALCTLGATGCDNWSFDLKTPGALEESGDKKFQEVTQGEAQQEGN